MVLYFKSVLLIACFLAVNLQSSGAAPSASVVGELLGYPASQIVFEDITDQERTLLQNLTRREQQKVTSPPDPASLLKAYRITGKNTNSFMPIQIYVGKRGFYMTPEVRDQLAKFDEASANQRGIFGTGGFSNIGIGGLLFSPKLKVLSSVPPLGSVDFVSAYISVVQPHGQDFDIKIAQRASLVDQTRELELIPGGEKYFNTYGSSSVQKAEPRLDLAKIFPKLTKNVISEWLAETGSTTTVNPQSNQTEPTVRESESVRPTTENQQTEPSPSSLWTGKWTWLVLLVAFVLAILIYSKSRRP